MTAAEEMEARYPGLETVLRGCSNPGLREVSCRSGGVTFEAVSGGRKVMLFSPYDPDRESERIVRGFRQKVSVQPGLRWEGGGERWAAVVYGSGRPELVYHLLELGVEVCVIETEPFLLNHFLQNWDERRGNLALVEFAFRFPPFRFDEMFRKWIQSRGVESFEVLAFSGLKTHDNVRFNDVIGRLRELVLEARNNLLVIDKFKRTWFRNIRTNGRFLKEWGLLGGIVDDSGPRPVVVCGAGPSLEESLDWLAENQDYIRVVCVDTALEPLLLSGVEPDIVVAIDAGSENVKDFDILRTVPARFLLVADVLVDPETFSRHSGEIVFAVTPISGWDGGRSAILDFFLGGKVPGSSVWMSGGSVAHNAIDLARRFFKGPLVLAGMDFCMRYRRHARGSGCEAGSCRGFSRFRQIELPRVDSSKEIFETLDRAGRTVLTDRRLFLFKRFIEEGLPIEKGRSAFVIGDKGIPIDGYEPLWLKDMRPLTKQMSRTRKTRLKCARVPVPEGRYFRETLEDTILELEKIKTLCEKGEDPAGFIQRYWNLERTATVRLLRELGGPSGCWFVRTETLSEKDRTALVRDRVDELLRAALSIDWTG